LKVKKCVNKGIKLHVSLVFIMCLELFYYFIFIIQ